MRIKWFGWNWPSGSWEDFLISSMSFHYYFIIFPLGKGGGGALHSNKIKSSPPKDALCQVWLKLAQWFWRRRLKCEKFTDRWSDGWQAMRKAHLRLQLRRANKKQVKMYAQSLYGSLLHLTTKLTIFLYNADDSSFSVWYSYMHVHQ